MRLIIINILILSFGIVYSQTNCDKYSEDYIPKNLLDALEYLNCKWPEKDKEDFKNKNEVEAVAEIHFGTGRAIRNNWGLWAKKRNSLVKYFNSLGIFHPDDISSIILTSFHRKLNNKDLDLKGQIQSYKDYWDKVNAENEIKEKEINKQINLEYNTFKLGDTVKIAFQVHVDTFKNVFLYGVQKYPDLSKESNCYVIGIAKGKKIRKDNYILKILVTDICGYKEANYSVLNDKFKAGETYDFFNLRFYKITKN